MKIEYEKEYLRELYENSQCSNKKYRFQPQVVEKYIRRIDTLIGATRIEDLYGLNSLNIEKIDQNNDIYSIRIDKKYRLEFALVYEESEICIVVARILDISNHYQ